ncbi:MAG: chromate resistance protein [Rhodospirillaceae bacterium]|nr:chromate resistance protein [Rhodospirillaceae bacterium]
MTPVKAATDLSTRSWLMLSLKLPSDAASARVKFWRRLNRLGAVALRNGFYALPNSPECREDFEWLRREILEAGGEALTLEARLMGGMTDDDLRAAFDEARNGDYEQLAAEAAELAGRSPVERAQVERVKREFRQIERVDFFGAAARTRASAALLQLDTIAAGRSAAPVGGPERGIPRGRIWVTRADPHIDRLASAWLIRRHVDPHAGFRFVTEPDYKPGERELRFDMFEAEYTHRGDRCTFEVLIEEGMIGDPAVVEISEIVHDIDIKDEKFGREEAPGVARMIQGAIRRYADDYERLERTMLLFDDLHASLSNSSTKT